MRRAFYRLGQFRAHLWPRPPGPADLAEIHRLLPLPLTALFRKQTLGEQAHALRVMRRVAAAGGEDAGQLELLQAALLHDVGKTAAPLSLLGRAAVVLVGWVSPRLRARLGRGRPRGMLRPFVTASRHAEWGAQLCAQAGAPPLTIELIRRHGQARPRPAPATPEDRMLAVLQDADDDS